MLSKFQSKTFVILTFSAFVLSYVVYKTLCSDKTKAKKPPKRRKISGSSTGNKNVETEPNIQDNAGSKPVLREPGTEMTISEAFAMTSFLKTDDMEVLQKVLVTVANASAFKQNQDILREAGFVIKLKGLLEKHSMAMHLGGGVAYPTVVNGITTTINNLAMNTENQQQLQGCIPALIDFATCDKSSIQLASLQALTNLSVTSQYHAPYTQLIQQLYDILDTGSHNLRLQALKILVNLSCNVEMVPHLLAARAPKSVLDQLSPDFSTPHLLRWSTVLAHILSTCQNRHITSTELPCEYKAASPETLYAALYGVDNNAKLKSKVFLLCKHPDEDVRIQATKMYNVLT